MSEGPQFNATSESGPISQGMKVVQGDEVQGDKNVDESQGKTEIDGDMLGNIENTNTRVEGDLSEAVEYVDNLEAEFNKAVADELEAIEASEIPSVGDRTEGVGEGEQINGGVDGLTPVKNAVEETPIIPFEEFDVESIDAEDPDPPMVFSAMRSMAAAPPEAADPVKAEGLFSRFKTMATKAGPKVGKALLAGSIAFAKGTVKQHPMYAGIQAGLESFQE